MGDTRCSDGGSSSEVFATAQMHALWFALHGARLLGQLDSSAPLRVVQPGTRPQACLRLLPDGRVCGSSGLQGRHVGAGPTLFSASPSGSTRVRIFADGGARCAAAPFAGAATPGESSTGGEPWSIPRCSASPLPSSTFRYVTHATCAGSTRSVRPGRERIQNVWPLDPLDLDAGFPDTS